MKANRDKRLAVCAAAAALALLAVYVLVAAKHRWFQLPHFDYMKQSRIVQGGIPSSQASSMLWKIGLLLPSAVLLAWALTVSGFRLKLPSLAKDKRFPLILGALAVLLIGCVIVFVLRGAELTDDENTYVFQAKTLLAGRLFNPPPPDLKSFDNKFIINDGSKYVGMYPFGFPMILAIGKLLGTEYAMTLLLAGALMVLVASLARAAYPDRRVSIVAPLLLFVSPFYYFVSASRLSHVATSVLLGSFALLYIRLFQNDERKRRTTLWMAFLCGILAGLAANIRPLTAAAFLLPFLPAMLVQVFSRPRKRYAVLILMGAGFLAMSALTLIYFKIITGDYFKSPITYYRPDFKLGPEMIFFSLGQAMRNLAHHIVRMNAFLFGFPASLMFLPCIGLCSKAAKADRAALGILGSFAGLYLLWGFPGVADLGPVYYFECIIPLVLLSSRGFLWLSRLREIAIPAPERFSVESSSPQCRHRVLDVPPRADHASGPIGRSHRIPVFSRPGAAHSQRRGVHSQVARSRMGLRPPEQFPGSR